MGKKDRKAKHRDHVVIKAPHINTSALQSDDGEALGAQLFGDEPSGPRQARYQVERVDASRWRIPRQGSMLTEGLIFSNDDLIKDLRNDPCVDQVANVAHLPGIVGPSMAMPDMHWGYGFPIGGVAAFDIEDGIICPGGIGFDINCLSPDAQILHRDGYTRSIQQIVEQRQETPVILRDTPQNTWTHAPVTAGMAKAPTKPIVEVQTESGRTLTASTDHPFLTPEGMRLAGDLAPGQRVAVNTFEGVPYEAPSSAVIVDVPALIATAQRLGVSDEGNAYTQMLNFLEPLLPLTFDHPALPTLLKLAGLIWGDGNLGPQAAAIYGEPHDLEALIQDVSPWVKISRIYDREREHAVPTAYGAQKFHYHEHMVRIASGGVALLLAAMGVPVGQKANQDWRLPAWLWDAPRWQQRLFLAAFFGAELTTPTAFKAHNHNFTCPILNQVKRTGFVESGVLFMEDISRMLNGFGVVSLKISQRIERDNPDGSQSIRLRLVLSDKPESLLNLWGRVGFIYNAKRTTAAAQACGYLAFKRDHLRRRQALHDKLRHLHATHGHGATTLLEMLAQQGISINRRFVERALYSKTPTTARVGDDFLTFDQWREKHAQADLIWETIRSITPSPSPSFVYDIMVGHPEHNFVANGFVVHNCGVRLLHTGLTISNVRTSPERFDRLMTALYLSIPSGVGTGRDDVRLKREDLDRIVQHGAAWVVENGWGEEHDTDRIEANGVLPGADPKAVSGRAFDRGKVQLGTLGSGNHFCEIGYIDAVFDPIAAEVFGLREGQITVMIHTGSRGFGYQVCEENLKLMLKLCQDSGFSLPDRQLCFAPLSSPHGQAYLSAMNAAANFAFANRQMITDRVRTSIQKTFGDAGGPVEVVYDVCHNIAKVEEHTVNGEKRKVCVHRKGATRAFPPHHPDTPAIYAEVGQPVLVPGDMGRYSYVLAGTEGGHETFGSCCHGAGRRLSRTSSRKRAQGRNILRELSEQGITVRAASRRTVDEEMPEAYKDVAEVVDVVAAAGIGRKVARIKPIGVVKG